MVRVQGFLITILPLLLYSVFTWLFLSERENEEMAYLASGSIFVVTILYVVFMIFILAMKYPDLNRTVIPRNLILLPLSSAKLYFLILIDLLFNVNTVGFLGSTMVILFHVPDMGIGSLIVALALILTFQVLIGIWVVNLYVITAELFFKYKHVVAVVPFMLLFSLQLVLQRTEEKSFKAIVMGPVVLLTLENRLTPTLVRIITLVPIAVVGLFVGLFIIRRFRYKLAG